MEAFARLSNLRVAPRKVRELVDEVRGKDINDALTLLKYSKRKRTADALFCLLKSAVSNASQKGTMNVDRLVVKTIFVGEGPRLKRFRPRAKGSAFPIIKGASHIMVTLAEK